MTVVVKVLVELVVTVSKLRLDRLVAVTSTIVCFIATDTVGEVEIYVVESASIELSMSVICRKVVVGSLTKSS